MPALSNMWARLCYPCGAEISLALAEPQEFQLGDQEPSLENISTLPQPAAWRGPGHMKPRSIMRIFRGRGRSVTARNTGSRSSASRHNLDAPINRLPLELLLDIFTRTCQSDFDKYLWERERRQKTTPLTLGGVCGYWRDVIWVSSALWSHIYLSLSKKRYTRQMKLLHFWLGRSGGWPLLLNLVLLNEEDWNTKQIPTFLIDTLVSHASRWQAISWVLPEAWYPRLNCIQDGLDNLYSICTQPTCDDADLSPNLRKRLVLLDKAPKLESVHLNGYYLTDVPLQWAKLTSLTLQQVYIDECYYALQRSPNLSKCKISKLLMNDVARTVEHPSSQLEMDQMRRLVLHAATWGDAVSLLVHLSFPVLETLDLTASVEECLFDQLSNAILCGVGGLGQEMRCRAAMIGSFSVLSKLVLHDLNFVPSDSNEASREKQLKDLLAQLFSLKTLDIKVRTLVGPVMRFSIWWFIDLLKVRSREDVHGGAVSNFKYCTSQAMTYAKDTQPENSSRSQEVAPATPPSDVFVHLPELQHFTFSVPSIFLHAHTSDIKTPENQDFMDALLALLRHRCSRASPYAQSADTMDSPLKTRLIFFYSSIRRFID